MGLTTPPDQAEARARYSDECIAEIAENFSIETGNLVGLAIAIGLDDRALRERFPRLALSVANGATSGRAEAFWKSVERARERLHFTI